MILDADDAAAEYTLAEVLLLSGIVNALEDMLRVVKFNVLL